ncbi:MAG: formate dehydrogenase [Hyphomicrobiaceae bacterium]
MAKTTDTVTARRDFLKLAGASLVGTGAAVAASANALAGSQPAEAAPTGDYRESAHVKRYYELARQF